MAKNLNILILLLLVSSFLFLYITGCGDDSKVIVTVTSTPVLNNVTITGFVMNNGIAVPSAYVRFYRDSVYISDQITDLDGKYTFSSLSAGNYRVEAWLSKTLYSNGQSATGATNITLTSPGTVTVNIINGQVAPTPVPTSTPVSTVTVTATVTATQTITATPVSTTTPSSGVWNPVIQ